MMIAAKWAYERGYRDAVILDATSIRRQHERPGVQAFLIVGSSIHTGCYWAHWAFPKPIWWSDCCGQIQPDAICELDTFVEVPD